MAQNPREAGRSCCPWPSQRCGSELRIVGARGERASRGGMSRRRDPTHLPSAREGHSPQQEAVAPPRYEYSRESRAIPVMRSGGAGAGAERAVGNCHPYHPAGTLRCGRTGTWFSGPHSSCRRAGAWGCRSGGGRTGCLPHSSGSRSPRRSTGPSRRSPLAARGQEKLLNPSLSLSSPSCSLPEHSHHPPVPPLPGVSGHPAARSARPSTAPRLCRGFHRPRASCHSWCGRGAPRCRSCTTAGRKCPPPWCWGSAGSPCQRSAGIAGPGCTGLFGPAARQAGRRAGPGHPASSHLGKVQELGWRWICQGLTPLTAPSRHPTPLSMVWFDSPFTPHTPPGIAESLSN